jgi:predicted RNA-binding protein associated with RNAse of E/G family
MKLALLVAPLLLCTQVYADGPNDLCVDFIGHKKRDVFARPFVDAYSKTYEAVTNYKITAKQLADAYKIKDKVKAKLKEGFKLLTEKVMGKDTSDVTDGNFKKTAAILGDAVKLKQEVEKALKAEKEERGEDKAKVDKTVEESIDATKAVAAKKDVKAVAKSMLAVLAKLWFRIVTILLKVAAVCFTDEAAQESIKLAEAIFRKIKNAQDLAQKIQGQAEKEQKDLEKVQGDELTIVQRVLSFVRPIAKTIVAHILTAVETAYLTTAAFLVKPLNPFISTFLVDEASNVGAETFCYIQYNEAKGQPKVEKFVRFFNPGASFETTVPEAKEVPKDELYTSVTQGAEELINKK